MRAFVAALALVLSVSLATAGEPSFEQHFGPSENLESIDVATLDDAGETIDIAAYVLTDVPVIEALANAASRGVKVRLFRQPETRAPSARIAAALEALQAAGAEQRFKRADGPLMHLKAYCVDGRLLRFGAANFSRAGLTAQNNDLDLSRGSHACDAFEAAFDRMWQGE